MENYIGKTCPFCKTEIKETDAVKVCPACGIPHHEGCWNENHGCTTFGCSEQHYEAQHTNPTDVCANCGTPLGDGQAFCPQCGTPKAAAPQKSFCGNCGTEIMEGQPFCSNCGCRAGVVIDNNVNAAINQFNANIDKKKGKRKMLPIILAIALVVATIFGGITYSVVQEQKAAEAERRKQEAVATYIENANAFYLKVLASGTTMEDIGNEIKTAWTAYVNSKYYNGKKYYSVDSAVTAALTHEAANVTKVKNNNSSIESMYKTLLIVPDTSNQQLMAIKAAVQTAYKAYQDMYNCVIDPSGSYNSWTVEFRNVDTELADAIGDIRTLVGK